MEVENTPRITPSWFKYARCPLCRNRYVVNNNIHHRIEPHRLAGVAICPNCFYRKGAERLVRIYKLGKKMTQEGVDINALVKEAKELFE